MRTQTRAFSPDRTAVQHSETAHGRNWFTACVKRVCALSTAIAFREGGGHGAVRAFGPRAWVARPSDRSPEHQHVGSRTHRALRCRDPRVVVLVAVRESDTGNDRHEVRSL